MLYQLKYKSLKGESAMTAMYSHLDDAVFDFCIFCQEPGTGRCYVNDAISGKCYARYDSMILSDGAVSGNFWVSHEAIKVR